MFHWFQPRVSLVSAGLSSSEVIHGAVAEDRLHPSTQCIFRSTQVHAACQPYQRSRTGAFWSFDRPFGSTDDHSGSWPDASGSVHSAGHRHSDRSGVRRDQSWLWPLYHSWVSGFIDSTDEHVHSAAEVRLRKAAWREWSINLFCC